MFGFGKKKDKLEKEEKEKRKKEKKDRKLAGNAEAGSRLTADDLLRLDDIRRSLKIGKHEKVFWSLFCGLYLAALYAISPQ
jgi:hypothetical protein